MGERTLLMDADLRRGKQTRKIVGKKVFGLADFLTGNSQVSPMQFEDKIRLPSSRQVFSCCHRKPWWRIYTGSHVRFADAV